MASQESTKLPSSSSSHRLPTVSASQALQNLKSSRSHTVSIGLSQLDLLLQGHGAVNDTGGATTGGLVRGQVTEIYGPPGVGKTTFGMQVCVSALLAKERAVWVDAASQMSGLRFQEILAATQVAKGKTHGSSAPGTASQDDPGGRFHHYTAPTLPHLLALFIHPPPSFPPEGTSVIVIDSISTLFDNAYPRGSDDRVSSNKNDATKWAAGRRYAVMNELISKLGKMAALHNAAVLLTCQTITRVRSGLGAVLLPAISGLEWDNGISAQIVLFRDWAPDQNKETKVDEHRLRKIRFAGLLKVGGAMLADGGIGAVVPFTIEKSGLSQLDLPTGSLNIHPSSSPVRNLKRSFAEVADSDGEEAGSDEDYGWVEEDEVAAEGLIDETALVEDLSAAV